MWCDRERPVEEHAPVSIDRCETTRRFIHKDLSELLYSCSNGTALAVSCWRDRDRKPLLSPPNIRSRPHHCAGDPLAGGPIKGPTQDLVPYSRTRPGRTVASQLEAIWDPHRMIPRMIVGVLLLVEKVGRSPSYVACVFPIPVGWLSKTYTGGCFTTSLSDNPNLNQSESA